MSGDPAGTARDTEARLREAERRFRLLADSAPMMAWMSGPDTLCEYFNAGWLRFTGRSLEQELGNGWAEGVHPDDLERCLKTYLESFEARRPFQMEYRLRRHDGEFRWVTDTGTPHFESDGRFAGYVGSCMDVHQQRETERRLVASLAEKDALLKEVHHRVKNNLQLIISLITLRSRQASDETQAQLSEIVQRILALSMVHEQMAGAPQVSSIDLSRYLADFAELMRRQHLHSGINLEVDTRSVSVPIGRATPIALIVNELVSNCYRHAFPDRQTGAIRLTLAPTGAQTAVLGVIDDGIGMDSAPEGAGMQGLQIVRALAQQAGGTLKIDRDGGTHAHLHFQAD